MEKEVGPNESGESEVEGVEVVEDDEQQGLDDDGDVKGKSKDDSLYLPSDEDGFTDEEKSKGRKRGGRKKGSGIPAVKAKEERGRKGRNSRRKTQAPKPPVRVPDLPKVAPMGALKRSAPPTAVIRDEKRVEEVGIKAALYRVSPESGAFDYEFRSWKGTVSSSVCSLTSIHPSDRMLSTNFLGE